MLVPAPKVNTSAPVAPDSSNTTSCRQAAGAATPPASGGDSAAACREAGDVVGVARSRSVAARCSRPRPSIAVAIAAFVTRAVDPDRDVAAAVVRRPSAVLVVNVVVFDERHRHAVGSRAGCVGRDRDRRRCRHRGRRSESTIVPVASSAACHGRRTAGCRGVEVGYRR